MFVLEALLLTFITTPMVTTLYPPHLRVHAAAKGANFDNVNGDEEVDGGKRTPAAHDGESRWKPSYIVVLDKPEVYFYSASLARC
jgi:hypothetical protein